MKKLSRRICRIGKPIGTADQVGRTDDHSRDAAQSIGGRGGQAVVLPSALELSLTSADRVTVERVEFNDLGGRTRQHVIGPGGGVLSSIDQFDEVACGVVIHELDVRDSLAC